MGTLVVSGFCNMTQLAIKMSALENSPNSATIDGCPFKGNTAMLDLYYWTTPNGHKITIFLEESQLPYRVIPVNISKGEQFKPEFLKISPNNRIPALVDDTPTGGGDPVSVFESGAILLYLAEKTGKFIPDSLRGRTEV